MNLVKGKTVIAEVCRNITREVSILSTPDRDLGWEEYSGEDPFIYFIGEAMVKNKAVYHLFFQTKESITPRLCEGWEEDETVTEFIKKSVKEAGLKLTHKDGYWKIYK